MFCTEALEVYEAVDRAHVVVDGRLSQAIVVGDYAHIEALATLIARMQRHRGEPPSRPASVGRAWWAFAAASSSTIISSPITRCPAASGTRSCNAHHLRELKALIDIDKEQWAGQMRDLLLDANESARAAVAEGAAALPTPVLRTLIKQTPHS